MGKYRKRLPQTANRLFVTDAGLETELVFIDGRELPHFAAFDLLKDDAGFERLRAYYLRYAEIATAHGLGLLLETPTWRASPDWGARLGYDRDALADANRRAVSLLLEIRATVETPATPVVGSRVWTS
jgi:S-methylmethionine-dependent homocysteine/selenocysteine methylase